MALLIGVGALHPVNAFADRCGGDVKFFGLKPWYAYLDTEELEGRGCVISESNFTTENGTLTVTIWTVALTVLNDILFVGGVIAVVLIIVSGLQFITSAGDAGRAARAKKSLTATIVGLIITLLAQVIVNTILTILNGETF